jgi:hypothetical protein
MLSVKVKADVIDADAHVVENERVWDYLEPSEEKYPFFPSTGENERGCVVLSETRPYPGPFDGVYPECSRMGSGQAFPLRDCVAIEKNA